MNTCPEIFSNESRAAAAFNKLAGFNLKRFFYQNLFCTFLPQ